MKKNNGFTFIEMLVAMSILFMLVATIIPIKTLMKEESKKLQDRRQITSALHDSLQKTIWSETDETIHEQSRNEQINLVTVHFEFMIENDFIKGCATWQNVRNIQEEICLYGAK